LVLPGRDPADGGDRARAGRLGQGADPRRADLQPRRGRGTRAVRGDAAAARAWHGDPVRHPLPRPGVRRVRPDHGAAQRHARGRIHAARAAAGGAGEGDGGARRGTGRRARRPRRHPGRCAGGAGGARPVAPRRPAYGGPAGARGRGGGAGRPARLGPHRTGAAAVRPGSRRRRHAAARGRARGPAPSRRRGGARPGPVPGGAQDRGHRCRTVGARDHRAGPAGPARLVARAAAVPAGRTRPPLRRVAGRAHGRDRDAGGRAVRRQPAEGGAGALAGYPAEAADPGRADPWHRHRRQAGNHGRSGAPGARGHGGAVHVRRARGAHPAGRPHRGAARAAQGGRAARRQRGRPGARPDRGTRLMATTDPDAQAPLPLHRRMLAHPLFWPLLALALLLLGNGLLNPGFLALEWRDGRLYGNLVDIANRAAPLVLVSMGMTLVIAARGLDISVGAVLAIAATVAAWTIGRMTAGGGTGLAPLFAAIGAALATAALCGLWNGVLVVKVGMQPIIATLILMVAGRGVAQLISGGNILTIY